MVIPAVESGGESIIKSILNCIAVSVYVLRYLNDFRWCDLVGNWLCFVRVNICAGFAVNSRTTNTKLNVTPTHFFFHFSISAQLYKI